MIKIEFVLATGDTQVVDIAPGFSLMEAAVQNDVPGIIGECGGACACGTCHVHISPEWSAVVGPAQGAEMEMLELASDYRQSSRLACQIRLKEALDGLVVEVPASQGL